MAVTGISDRCRLAGDVGPEVMVCASPLTVSSILSAIARNPLIGHGKAVEGVLLYCILYSKCPISMFTNENKVKYCRPRPKHEHFGGQKLNSTRLPGITAEIRWLLGEHCIEYNLNVDLLLINSSFNFGSRSRVFRTNLIKISSSNENEVENKILELKTSRCNAFFR